VEVDTVFSVGIAARIPEDGSVPLMDVLGRLGIEPRPNAKINLGMGRLSGGG
jgi:hypothetical protein